MDPLSSGCITGKTKLCGSGRWVWSWQAKPMRLNRCFAPHSTKDAHSIAWKPKWLFHATVASTKPSAGHTYSAHGTIALRPKTPLHPSHLWSCPTGCDNGFIVTFSWAEPQKADHKQFFYAIVRLSVGQQCLLRTFVDGKNHMVFSQFIGPQNHPILVVYKSKPSTIVGISQLLWVIILLLIPSIVGISPTISLY